jgi:hypothetical protein
MPNPWEAAARERKVGRLLAALDAEFGHLVTEAELNEATVSVTRLRAVLQRAEVARASQTTIDLLVERIRAREAA